MAHNARKIHRPDDAGKLVAAVRQLVGALNLFYETVSRKNEEEFHRLLSGMFFDHTRKEVMLGQWDKHQRASDIIIPICEEAGLKVVRGTEGWGVRSEGLNIQDIQSAGHAIMAKLEEMQSEARNATMREHAGKVARVFDAHAEELDLSRLETEGFLGYVREASRTLPHKGVQKLPDSESTRGVEGRGSLSRFTLEGNGSPER